MGNTVDGFGLSLGMGDEVNWGVAVARDRWIRLRSHGIERRIETVPVDHQGSYGQLSSNDQEHYVTSDNVEGPIDFSMCYDDASLTLIRHILGSVATTANGAAFDHEITLGQLPPGLTLEVIRGTSRHNPQIPTAEVFSGCRFAGANISMAAGGLMYCSADVIGRTSGGLIVPTGPVYSPGGQDRIKFNHSAQLSFNGEAYDLRSLGIRVDRGLERQQEFGSLFTQCPTGERTRVTLTMEMLWRKSEMYAAYLANASADATITLTGSGDNALVISAHNAVINSYSKPTSGAGAIPISVAMTAYADQAIAGNQGMALTFTNANANAEAN